MRFALLLPLLLFLNGCKQPVDYQTKADQVAAELAKRTHNLNPEQLRGGPLPFDMSPGPERFDPDKVASESAKIKELRIEDVVVGSGPVATEGRYLTVHYVGRLPDRFIFDTSLRPGGRAFTFKLGDNSVIKGWDLGLKDMKVGGVRRLIIPANLAYGDRPQDPTRIPPNAALIFDIELLFVGDTP